MTTLVLQGDARTALRGLPDGCVQCVVTSPPFFNLRDYGTATWEGGGQACDHVVGEIRTGLGLAKLGEQYRGGGHKASEPKPMTAKNVCPKCGALRADRQIGLEKSPEEYIAEIVAVFREVRRVMRTDAIAWLNLGSSYASGGRNANQSRPSGRVPAYDIRGTALPSSPDSDCAYPGLDDAPLNDSRFRRDCKGNTDPKHRLTPSLFAPTARDNAPKDCEAAFLGASVHDAPLSTKTASFENAPVAFAHADATSADLSDDQTSLVSMPRSSDNSAFLSSLHSSSGVSPDRPPNTPYSAGIDDPSAFHTVGKGAGSVPLCDCGSCGVCFAYSTMPMLQFKAKDLMLIPELVALALQADGWWLRSDIIWNKPNTMPSSVTDRPTSCHEHVFMLTKSAKYFFDAEAVKEPATSNPADKRRGDGAAYKFKRTLASTHMGVPEGGGRNIRNVWTIATSPFAKSHFASFPVRLVEPCIKAGTSEHGRCNVCGAPFRRIVQKGEPDLAHQIACGSDATGNYDGTAQKDYASAKAQNASDVKRRILAGMVEKRTIGWKPTCLHTDAKPIPCLVLDPFGGSGTVGVVANRLGRDAILYDLNPEYVTMAEERIEEDERKRGVV